MRLDLNISKRELAIWCASWVAVFVCAASMFWLYESGPQSVARFGWSPEAEAAHADVAAAMPPFQIVDADGNAVVQGDNARANVRLWHATLKVHGKHRPNIPQQDNDCTAFGAMHAVELLQDIAIANGEATDWHPLAPHYIYGRSKHPPNAAPFRGEGCSGAYTAKCVMEGVLAADTPGVPAYSGKLSRDWGQRGPPAQWITEAKKYPVRQTSPCRSPEEIRDAVVNLYPVTIASNVGFAKIIVRDGRRVGVMSGEWCHQMAIVGYDGSGREQYWYVLNSWGDDAHGKPLQDEPPGGFWIDEDSCRAIADQHACFAYSSFAGFQAREFHFDLFSTERPSHENDHRSVRVAAGSDRTRSTVRSVGEAGHASRSLGL